MTPHEANTLAHVLATFAAVILDEFADHPAPNDPHRFDTIIHELTRVFQKTLCATKHVTKPIPSQTQEPN